MRLILGGVAILLIASLVPFAGTAVASDARLDALGVQYEYMEDYELFRFFPTVAARYDNLVTISLGGRNDEGDFGRDYSVGVIGSGDNTSYGTFAVYLNNVGEDAQFDLAWARQFSGMALGIDFFWQDSKTETGDYERSPIDGLGSLNRVAGMNQFSVIGGVNFDLSDVDQVEIAAELASLYWTFTNGDGSLDSKDAGNLTYRFVGRMMKEVSPRTTLVPLVGYTHLDITPEGAPENHYVNKLDFGVAMHHEVNDNDLLVLGIAANYRKSRLPADGMDEVSRWDLPALFAALEFRVTDWLTARAGATKTLDVINRKPDDPRYEETDTIASRYHFGLGAGFHFENFDVDITLNPDAMFSGGYLVSGEETRPIHRITATYFF